MGLTQWETLCGLFFCFFEKIVVPILTSGGHIDVFLAVPLQLLDLPQPGNVGIDRVHRKPHQLSIERLELVDHRAKGHKLRGADRGEIRGMGEEDHPFAGVILREFDRALRSDSLEGRGLVANKRHSVFLIHGMRSLC